MPNKSPILNKAPSKPTESDPLARPKEQIPRIHKLLSPETKKSSNLIPQKRLGHGTFGIVIQVTDKVTGEVSALKIPRRYTFVRNDKELTRDCEKDIQLENKMYLKMKDVPGVVGTQIVNLIVKYADGLQECRKCMKMDLVGPTLTTMLKDCGKFKYRTIQKLAVEMLEIIKQFHKRNFVHRDIKPDNYALDPTFTKLYLLDLGLATTSGEDEEQKASFAGTSSFASINMLKGLRPTARDDIESIGYTLIHLFTKSLPWSKLKGMSYENLASCKTLIMDAVVYYQNTSNEDHTLSYIHTDYSKEAWNNAILHVQSWPAPLRELLYYVYNMDYDEIPDYDDLAFLFNKGGKSRLKYQWE